MASIFSHAAAALALAPVCFGRATSGRVLAAGAIGAMAPDADVVGFAFGIQYGDLLGHRGLTHSLAFAVGAAFVLSWLARAPNESRRLVWAFLFAAVASHGILDAFTDGGLGIAFFSPFDSTRYFFPVRPILVSPIGVSEFFSPWGRAVIASELRWVWLPACLVAVAGLVLHRRRSANRVP